MTEKTKGIRAENLCWIPSESANGGVGPIDLFQSSDKGITIVSGSNGAGKSLLVNMLAGVLLPTSGRVYANVSRSIVFQQPIMFRRSVIKNLLIALNAVKATSDEKYKLAWEKLQNIELTTRANDPAGNLSGGEQRRLAIARAMLMNPEIMFLDEPTTFLDKSNATIIENVIKEMSKKIRIVLVTHDIKLIDKLPDKVIRIRAGKILT